MTEGDVLTVSRYKQRRTVRIWRHDSGVVGDPSLLECYKVPTG